jgi:hypothetical protein
MRRLSVIMCFHILFSIFIFTGCDTTVPDPGTDVHSKPIAVVIQDDITVINITHTVDGQSTKFTVEGDSLDDLRIWVANLQYKHQTYTKGNSPGDVNGGEVYSFEMAESDYPGFSYIINGVNNCYLLIEDEWYTVSNPSNPMVAE